MILKECILFINLYFFNLKFFPNNLRKKGHNKNEKIKKEENFMKKIISIFAIIAILSMIVFVPTSNAAALDTIDIQLSETTVKPGEEVKININFGQNLGAYTFDIDFDNDIFDYVNAEGGVGEVLNDKLKVTFYDTTGGASPRNNMSATFKAKADITTSNPTEFTVTAEGLANPDASVQFDDINTPIVKNLTVEPEYIDYTLKMQYTGDIIKGQEKPITVSYSSPMGHYYEHARLVAEATSPTGANVKLLANDQANLEHDIIDSGWGDAQGSKIGGKDVAQVLQTRGIFSKEGNYTITLKLIDRDNSDSIIAQKTFNFAVLEKEEPVQPTNPVSPSNPDTTQGGSSTTETKTDNEKEIVEKAEETPKKLPKTGINLYIPVAAILIVLISAYAYHNKRS